MENALDRSETYRHLESLTSEPFNEELKKWKEDGGKIVGCLYDQVPDEIITAAGMVAYRPRAVGSHGDEFAEARFTQVNCSLIRNFYDSAKRGRFDFMDGLVVANSCDHIRKLYENWKDAIGLPYGYLICFPKHQGPAQTEELGRRFGEFKADFEKHFGVKISDEGLRAAIELHNHIRAQQSELDALRRGDAPKLSGTQFMTIMIAGTCMPKALYSKALDTIIAECKAAEGITDFKARVVVYGGEIDETDLIATIEDEGAIVVGDSLGSFGSRAFDYQTSTEGDLMYNLAKSLLDDRTGEPRIFGTRESRWAKVREIYDASHAQGIIQVHIPICDLWSYERMMFDTYVEKEQIPCLDLDTEYVFSNTGQTKTRVQAFCETLSEGGR